MKTVSKVAMTLGLLVLLAIGHNLITYAPTPGAAFVLGGLVYGAILWALGEVWLGRPKAK